MKAVLVFLSLGLFTANSALAGDEAKTSKQSDKPATDPNAMVFEFGLMGGLSFFADDHELYDHTILPQRALQIPSGEIGLRFGFLPIKYFGVEIEAALMPAKTVDNQPAMPYAARIHVLGQYPWVVTPFVTAGATLLGISSSNDALGSEVDPAFHWGLGLKYQPDENIYLRLDGRHNVASSAPAGVSGVTNHFEVLLGFGGRLVLSKDSDKDGVGDKDDLCPDVAGTKPSGCPDADKDDVFDHLDKCPNKAEDLDGFQDEDGCPEPDNDGDGVPDADDACPSEAGSLETKGCADEDQDGIADTLDECRSDAEDIDGFQDEDGCPDNDNDGDGVEDSKDRCKDTAGVVENRGCPDVDSDEDGIVDRLDNCPKEKGIAANSGCQNKQLVKIVGTKIELEGKVFFDSGTANIQKKSFTLLNNVAQVLNAHEEITQLNIEGHTDSQGDRQFNIDLSQRRADAVKAYLESKEVNGNRLLAVGRGPDKAIADNATADGRAANRRVEFNIFAQ